MAYLLLILVQKVKVVLLIGIGASNAASEGVMPQQLCRGRFRRLHLVWRWHTHSRQVGRAICGALRVRQASKQG